MQQGVEYTMEPMVKMMHTNEYRASQVACTIMSRRRTAFRTLSLQHKSVRNTPLANRTRSYSSDPRNPPFVKFSHLLRAYAWSKGAHHVRSKGAHPGPSMWGLILDNLRSHGKRGVLPHSSCRGVVGRSIVVVAIVQ